MNLSLRQVSGIIGQLMLLLQLEFSEPSHTSIRNWVRKASYYKLEFEAQLDSEEEQWVLIVDESASIGREKILLILGVPLSNHNFEESVKHSEIVCLYMASRESWTKIRVSGALKQVKSRLKGTINYIVSDRGSVLLSGFNMGNYNHVPDISHHFASVIEGFYSKDKRFKTFMSAIAKVRQKWIMSKNSKLIPPNMRTKSRFLNLFDVIDWLEKITLVYEHLEEEQKEGLSFIQSNKKLYRELKQIVDWIRGLSKEFKVKGLRKNAVARAQEIMKTRKRCRTTKCKTFRKSTITYLEQILDLLPNEKCIICCSDIIESFFGKFKYRKANCGKGISDDMLVMALFNEKLNRKDLKTALEEVTLSEIKKWGKDNSVPTLRKVQYDFWRNVLPKTG